MICISFIGCHRIHRPAGGYFLMALMIIGIVLGLRILLHILARCVQRLQAGPATSDAYNREVEMRRERMLAAAYSQQWRSSGAVCSSLPPPEKESECWQSKLVISAGHDQVLYIAHPCPLRETGIVK